MRKNLKILFPNKLMYERRLPTIKSKKAIFKGKETVLNISLWPLLANLLMSEQFRS